MSDALNPSGQPTGRARIGASALLLESRVGSLVKECRYRYPGVAVSPRQLAVRDAAGAVRGDEVDIALVHGDPGAGGPLPAGVVVEELPPLEVVPVGTPAVAADLRGRRDSAVRVIAVDPDCPSHRTCVDALRSLHGIDPVVVEAGSVGGALELARGGYGMAMLPVETLRHAGGGSGLPVIPDLPHVVLDVHALWTGGETARTVIAAVCEVAKRIGRPPMVSSSVA
ncbi:substrate-binding domain-containing protein [Streptomyces calidiresistens]|nr:LysR family transcriptional regulator [Streptomyces calidiresistens]